MEWWHPMWSASCIRPRLDRTSVEALKTILLHTVRGRGRPRHTSLPPRTFPHSPALPSLLRRGYIPRSRFMQEALMPTEGRPEAHAKNFGENIESDLALEFLRVVENAAVESARTMG